MKFNPDYIQALHSQIFSGGITDGFYFGGWDRYLNLSDGLREIGANKSRAVIDHLLAWLTPHYESGGIDAVWKEIERNEKRAEELTDRYFDTNEDVRQLILDFVERELSE